MFRNCPDKDSATKLYKRLAFRLHPDHGGSNDLFMLLYDAYNEHIKILESEIDMNLLKDKSSHIERKYKDTDSRVKDGDDKLDIIVEMYEYAENHTSFETKFLDSVCIQLKDNGSISAAQYNALVKIYYSFRIDKENEP